MQEDCPHPVKGLIPPLLGNVDVLQFGNILLLSYQESAPPPRSSTLLMVWTPIQAREHSDPRVEDASERQRRELSGIVAQLPSENLGQVLELVERLAGKQ